MFVSSKKRSSMFEDFAYHFCVWFCITFIYYALSIMATSFLIHFYEKIEVKCIRDPLPFEEVIFRSISTQIAFLDP